MPDEYVKIAGQNPSDSIRREKFHNADEAAEEFTRETENGNIDKARIFGIRTAKKFIECIENPIGEEDTQDESLKTQRTVLLAFSAFARFEEFYPSQVVSDISQSSFLKYISEENPELYVLVKDSGSLSFYYLAYRRGLEIDRRIGQTFAMLCMHDGDLIYQELGEALYCWFSSVVDSIARECGF